ncbi:MFS transporter [Bordetella petrii]|nr:MFS transporter [Bordetella petrii]
MQSAPPKSQIGMLVLATSVVQLANGFFGTFISLRVATEGFGPAISGVILSSYFAGFTVGALRCERIIGRVGHIRAYASFAGMIVAATMMMPLLPEPLAWILLRAVVGFGCAGIFITTESWLNAKARPAERGRTFSVYMLGTFLALALGQILIGRTRVETMEPFNGIAVLFAVALVLVSTARAEPPGKTVSARLPFTRLFRAAPVAVAGCLASGIITSSFYSLVPAWMQGEGLPRETIALFMLVAVLGGLAFQIPVGRLSDYFDRRAVLIALSAGFAVAAIAVVNLPHSRAIVLPMATVLGGLMSALYPVCVANAHDRMPADQVVAVSGQLILTTGVGSILGPLIGTVVMSRFGIDGLLYFLAAASVTLSLIAMGGRLLSTQPIHQDRTFELLAPQASSLAHDQLGATLGGGATHNGPR